MCVYYVCCYAAQRAAQAREEKIQQWETFGVVSKPKKPKPKVGYAMKQESLDCLVCDVLNLD